MIRGSTARRVTIGAVVLSMAIACGTAPATRVLWRPKKHGKSGWVPGQAAVPPGANAKGKKPKVNVPTGIDLWLPAGTTSLPRFRIARPDGDPIEGPYADWSDFVADAPGGELVAPSDAVRAGAAAPDGTGSGAAVREGARAGTASNAASVTDASNATSGGTASAGPDTGPTTATGTAATDTTPPDGRWHEGALVPSGDYRVLFALPAPTADTGEFTGDIVWSQSVRVTSGKPVPLGIRPPAIGPSAMAHVRLKIEAARAAFNSLTLEPVGIPPGGVSSRWEYFPEGGWPDELPLALLKGHYRVLLGSTSIGAFSSLRYELPAPLELGATGDVTLRMPAFHRLKASLVDRKGTGLIGVPITLQGNGETRILTASAAGTLDIRLPEGHYAVRALVLDGTKDREVTLERDLDMSRDQERSWRAPVTSIDFGFTRSGS